MIFTQLLSFITEFVEKLDQEIRKMSAEPRVVDDPSLLVEPLPGWGLHVRVHQQKWLVVALAFCYPLNGYGQKNAPG